MLRREKLSSFLFNLHTGIGGICPVFLIFGRCVVWHLWYFWLLNSQPSPHYTNWGSGASILQGAVLMAPILVDNPHPLAPLDLGVAFIRNIFLGIHPGSWFLVRFHAEVSTALPWWRAWLGLEFCSLFFGFAWSYSVLKKILVRFL